MSPDPFPDAMVEAFLWLPTAAISDALDRFGIAGQCLGVGPVHPAVALAGRAYTIRYRPAGAIEKGTVGDYIDDVPVGAVVVLDNEGRLDCTVWGDILTGVAHRRGLGGTVINGVCRTWPGRGAVYPVFSRGRFMRTGRTAWRLIGSRCRYRWAPSRSGLATSSSAMTTAWSSSPGPRGRLLAAATDIDDAEQAIEAAVAAGSRLNDARKMFRYHRLQGEPGRPG